MKKLTKRTTFIVNVILVLIVFGVYAFSFIPEKIVPISGADSVQAIYNGNRQNPNVSLMFNVYENTNIVNGILDELKTQGVKATFFVGGCWADDNGETLVRIVQEGHEIGNHGYFHKDHKKLTYEGNYTEISSNHKIIKGLIGYDMSLFAPPSGSFSKTTLKCAKELGYQTIMWSKDTIDWRDSDKNLIIKRATENLTSGDLILMHPKDHTLVALPEIIDKITQKGLKCVTVSDCCGL